MPKRQRPRGYLAEAEYQANVKRALERIYGQVTIQWCPFHGEGRATYAPRVDVAVGPYALRDRRIEEYTAMMEGTRPFIERLLERHNRNLESFGERTYFDDILHFNDNSRCFLAIEIEESGSRKHCLGNLVNASALGRIGLLVARTEKVFRVFLRQRAYLKFLAEVGKNTFNTANALVLTQDQFDEALELQPRMGG